MKTPLTLLILIAIVANFMALSLVEGESLRAQILAKITNGEDQDFCASFLLLFPDVHGDCFSSSARS